MLFDMWLILLHYKHHLNNNIFKDAIAAK